MVGDDMRHSRALDCVPLPEMDTADTAEKRRTTRIACRLPVLLQTTDRRDVEATCLNVNSSGIGIETESVLSVGQRLKLLLRKHSGELKPVPMLVIYRMEKQYGLSALDSYEDLLDLVPLQG